MINCHSIEELFREITQREARGSKDVFVILVAGCSRAGKSTLSNKIAELLIQAGHHSPIVNVDSWLIDVDKRKPNSTVSERYDLEDLHTSVAAIMDGRSITPPIYNPVSRKRQTNMIGPPIQIEKGFLIIEGVIALSDKELLKIADLTVFVNIGDRIRIRRMLDFYSRVKKLTKPEYKRIIREREKEEIPFVKSTAEKADIVFSW